ncbi:MAG: VWA domain-containing protein [Actinomycetales bacterium]|nr:VWA domain-containing protein [Actinomycetales bacterium]
MHVNAHLDIDLVALDEPRGLTCLLEITAPEGIAADRPPRTLIMVLDRSGSMAGERLAAAQEAICDLVRRLSAADSFGLVTFDNEAVLALPVRPMGQCDRSEIARQVRAIRPGGSTNLGAGYLIALREARAVVAEMPRRSATILLLSDGHANQGLVDADQLFGLAQAAAERVTTSTVGIGASYDETLLEALSRGGAGVHHFAPDPDSAAAIVADTVSDLLSVSALATTVRVVPAAGIAAGVSLLQQLPVVRDGDGLVATIGDLYAGEERRLLLRFDVPRLTGRGPQVVAHITVVFTAADTLTEHRITVPVTVTALPRAEVGTPLPNPIVEVERLLWETDVRMKEAVVDLQRDDPAAARRRLAGLRTDLEQMAAPMAAAAPAHYEDLRASIAQVEQRIAELDSDGEGLTAKRMMAQASASARGGMSKERAARIKSERAERASAPPAADGTAAGGGTAAGDASAPDAGPVGGAS